MKKSLLTRPFDFWFLGGASLVVWGVFVLFQFYREVQFVNEYFASFVVTFSSLQVLVNYPHFMASYKLAYSRGKAFIFHNWFALLFIPFILVFYLFWAYLGMSGPYSGLLGTDNINMVLDQWNLGFQLPSHVSLGSHLMNFIINVMFLTVGWHYTRQVYGCMMVYSYYDNYLLNALQRKMILFSLYSIWIVSLVNANLKSSYNDYWGLKYYSFQLGESVYFFSQLIVVVGFLFFLYFICFKNFKQLKKWPSPNFLVSYVAMHVWWFPMFIQHEYFAYAVPFFHSLQYLPFVYKLEKQNASKLGDFRKQLKITIIVFLLILLGFLSFDLVPNVLDKYVTSEWSFFFFIASFSVFINIHHYFIDSVIWRFKDPVVKQALLS